MHRIIRISSICILYACCFSLPAQQLIPYFGANGLYGFADAKGKVLTPPQFYKTWLPNEQGLALAATEEDRMHLVRQDGTVLPANIPISKWGAPAVEPVINYSANGILLDTLPNLWCLRSATNEEYLFVKKGKKGWESSQYLHYEALKSSVPVYGSYINENYIIGPMSFCMGLHRVIKGEHKVNFINSSGAEIFSTDYENGTILKNGYLSLASPEGLFALANPQGKLLTPFSFKNIIGTPRRGYFVINCKSAQYSNTAGLMREDGSLAIDTVYEELISVTDEWIIARKDYQYGLLNYEGDTLLPFQYTSLDYAEKTFFIAVDRSGQNIIDISGKPQLEKPWPKIRFVKNYSAENLGFYELAEGGRSKLTAILNTNLQQLFVDSIRELSLQGTHFLITQAGITQAVYDYTGKQLVPPYTTIEQLRYCGGYLVQKDSLFGVYTSDGRVALPCQYTKIVEEVTGSSCILWANTQKNKNQFAPFTPEGERLPIADQIMPTMRVLELKNCFAVEQERGQWKLILPDGSWVYKSQEYSRGIINVGTPDGCLLVEKGKETCEVLDPFLKTILPKGFTLPTKNYRGPYLQMGLIPVYKGDQSGIIDTRGNWVKKPGPFQYHILRPNMYSEHKGQPQNHNLEGATIYTITPQGTTQSVEVNLLDDKFNNGYLIIGRLFDDAPAEVIAKNFYAGKVFKYALMDTLGQLLSPFILAQHPSPRGDRWLAQIYTDDYRVKNVVLNEKAQIVLDFGDEPVVGYDAERHWIYFSDASGNTGIRDTLGKEILPAQYQEIQWPLPGKLFTSRLPGEKRQLCTLAGKVLLTGIKYVKHCQELPGGNILVIDDQRAHIFRPDFTRLCSTPADREAELIEGYPDLLRLKSGDGYQWVYLNFRTGVVYRGE